MDFSLGGGNGFMDGVMQNGIPYKLPGSFASKTKNGDKSPMTKAPEVKKSPVEKEKEQKIVPFPKKPIGINEALKPYGQQGEFNPPADYFEGPEIGPEAGSTTTSTPKKANTGMIVAGVAGLLVAGVATAVVIAKNK